MIGIYFGLAIIIYICALNFVRIVEAQQKTIQKIKDDKVIYGTERVFMEKIIISMIMKNY